MDLVTNLYDTLMLLNVYEINSTTNLPKGPKFVDAEAVFETAQLLWQVERLKSYIAIF